MKHKSYILLLLASVVILTSMSECKFNLNPWRIEHSYVTAELNDKLYVSTTAEAYDGRRPRTLSMLFYDEYFCFEVQRQLFSGENSVWLLVEYRHPSHQIELNKKYDLMEDDRTNNRPHVTSSGYEYYLTEGFLVFTSYLDGDHFTGTFEFTAYNQELDSTIVVTNGTFELDGTERDPAWE